MTIPISITTGCTVGVDINYVFNAWDRKLPYLQAERGFPLFIRYIHFFIQFPKSFIIIQQLSISECFRGALLGKYEKCKENQRLKNTRVVLQISPQPKLGSS